MIFAYNKDGIIATDRVPNGITVIAACYQKFTGSVLRPQIRKLRPEKIDSGVSISHNNARLHVAHTSCCQVSWCDVKADTHDELKLEYEILEIP